MDKYWALICFLMASCTTAVSSDNLGPQVAAKGIDASVARPMFERGRGPRIAIDQSHNNYHTVDGRYAPFAEVLRNDGYNVAKIEQISPDNLQAIDILVIANPGGKEFETGTPLSPASIYQPGEVAAIKQFVENGGSLLLILDHMPFPAAGKSVAEAFGFKFYDGFAMEKTHSQIIDHFRRADGALVDHPIIEGSRSEERIDEVWSFTGSAFAIPPAARPLMRFTQTMRYFVFLPDVPWHFTAETPRMDAAGLYQGATLEFGKGRIAVFGEAAMFTAQVGGNGAKGFNVKGAERDKQFLLNVTHWLAGRI